MSSYYPPAAAAAAAAAPPPFVEASAWPKNIFSKLFAQFYYGHFEPSLGSLRLKM